MCRLFALKANRPVNVEFSLVAGERSFEHLSLGNPDGWGVGWYERGTPRLKKEPITAADPGQYRAIATSRHSKTFVAHVRITTGSAVRAENCHPFTDGRWLFAHNGSVDREALLEKLDTGYRAELQGGTDSEVYFHWLLQNIERYGSLTEGLAAALPAVRASSYSGLNFVLTDGFSLHAFRDASRRKDYYSLFYLCRGGDTAGPLVYQSKETSALLHSKALAREQAVLVCSETLTDEEWVPIPLGHLLSVSDSLEPELTRMV